MPGRLIAIEGVDGSGKGTQAKRLYERLLAAGRKTALFSFPRYSDTHFGGFIGEYLNGRYGSLDEVHPFLAALLFAGDRFESRGPLLEALAANDVVLCDRYVSSNIAHQAAKLPVAERPELIRRIETVEYDVYGLPRADRTILLDLPVVTAKRLIANKAKRSYTDQAEDLHESDGVYLGAVREMYLALGDRSPGWSIAACEQDGTLRSIDDIAEAVAKAVADLF
ncbi:MAG: thymidylate kinase [Planctomycetaceae bacterium]